MTDKDCWQCRLEVSSPIVKEAIASTAIEKNCTAAELTERYLKEFHRNGHRR